MKYIRTFTIRVLLLLLFACQPYDSTETGLSPTLNPISTDGEIAPDENLLLSTKSLQQALSEAGAEVAL